MKRVSVCFIAAVLLGTAAALAGADTGTYRILDYRVTLAPRSDGKVAIDYYQKWRVTGGHIPWVTIGVPNEDIEGLRCGLNAKAVSDASEGGWSGIRLDLDRDYQPGQRFEISASLVQNRLFYADQENYRLDFTPGWYDRARTDHLEIRLKSLVKPEIVKGRPEPTSRTVEELIWTKDGLGEGERYTVSIAFPKNASAQAIPQGNLKAEGGKGITSVPSESLVALFVIGVVALIVIIWLVRAAMRGGRRSGGGRYTGGDIFYGGGGRRGSEPSPRRSGGGGGFGGRGVSCACACACVSCACACACAGGGAAGCSRKTRHACYRCAKGARS